MEMKTKPPKDKRRNNEKRKEKSRDAARSRRSRETEIFTDLANELPFTQEQIAQLDKASVMRLTIAHARVRDIVNLVPNCGVEPEDKKKQRIECNINESMLLKSLEGFLVVISSEGDFVYLSENVSDYLGILQIDLMGQNVFEYSHPCDHNEIRDILSTKVRAGADEDCQTPKSFFIRLKCTLTSKGRSVNLKSATYKVIHCTGHIVQQTDDDDDNKKENGTKGGLKRCLVAVGQPIPHPSNIETPLPRQTFLTKHSLDMKFTDADDKIMKDILGYDSDDLVGKAVYEYHHAMDSGAVCSAFKSLFSKGQCETSRYRFLAKTGGYVWVLTQATLIYDKMQKPQSVVCVNYVISGVECKDEIYSTSQLACVKTENLLCENNNNTIAIVPEIVLPLPVVVDDNNDDNDDEVIESKQSTIIINNNNNDPTTLITTATITAKLFSPLFVEKTNCCSNTSSSCSSSTSPSLSPSPAPLSPSLLLTTPAPRPQTTTSKIFAPRTEEMNKGFLTFSDEEPGLTMLKDEPDDLTHLAPVAGDVCVPLDDPFLTDIDDLLSDNFGPLLADEPSDPFISYRNTYDQSPQLLSPNLSKHSECSLPSLNSPSDSLGDEDQMSTFMNLQMDDDCCELTTKNFNSMNTTDDLSILIPNDLMWNTSNDRCKTLSNGSGNSSLAQLLLNKHTLKSNDHGGGLIETSLDDYNCNDKILDSNWNHIYKNNTKTTTRATKRSNNNNNNSATSDYETSNKKCKTEPKIGEKMSSELLQQLMSNNHHRGRPKGKSNWLLDSGGQKAACISQPSDSVLMNLLDDPMVGRLNNTRRNQDRIRKNSLSLLDRDAAAIPSLMDLSQQDFEVNAPVNSQLLQGRDLITALEATAMGAM